MGNYKNFDTYISQDHHKDIKESFKKIDKLISNSLEKKKNVLDVGCASGALISFLKSCHSEWEYTGIDISKDLLNIARKKLPDVNWIEGSGINMPDFFTEQFDLVTCIGVLGIFDEIEARKLFDELIRSTKPGGEIIVFSQFNEMNVDTQITHRKYNKNDEHRGWEKGFNNYSQKTIHNWLDTKVESVEFINFSLPLDLEQKEDLVRSWTIDINKKRRLTNGLKLIIDLEFLKLRV
jgi:ubiquinone/menaquinone biosynthesis C-methylase UbiE